MPKSKFEIPKQTIITGACIAWQYLGTNGINMSDFLESQIK